MDQDEPAGLSCPECRSWFVPRRRDQGYCSEPCNRKAAVREQTRGRRVYRALYWWRYDRSGGFGKNMVFVCREVASWIREDRQAQRLPPPPHNHDADRGHEREPQGVKLGKVAR